MSELHAQRCPHCGAREGWVYWAEYSSWTVSGGAIGPKHARWSREYEGWAHRFGYCFAACVVCHETAYDVCWCPYMGCP